MTKTQETALAAGALTVGAALLARGLRASRSMDFRGCSAVVTGGSRGLGLLVARELGRQGARITMAARDEAELERARQDLADRGIDATTVVCDIANQDEAQRLIDGVVARTGRIDVLVNNAGVIKVGPLEHMERDDFEEAMAVHFWGPLQTMTGGDSGHAPSARRDGSSTCRRSAERSASRTWCRTARASSRSPACRTAMRGEIAKDGIHVTTVCPGMMRTGSPFNAWFKGRHRDEFTWFAISDSLPIASIDAAARGARRSSMRAATATRSW